MRRIFAGLAVAAIVALGGIAVFPPQVAHALGTSSIDTPYGYAIIGEIAAQGSASGAAGSLVSGAGSVAVTTTTGTELAGGATAVGRVATSASALSKFGWLRKIVGAIGDGLMFADGIHDLTAQTDPAYTPPSTVPAGGGGVGNCNTPLTGSNLPATLPDGTVPGCNTASSAAASDFISSVSASIPDASHVTFTNTYKYAPGLVATSVKFSTYCRTGNGLAWTLAGAGSLEQTMTFSTTAATGTTSTAYNFHCTGQTLVVVQNQISATSPRTYGSYGVIFTSSNGTWTPPAPSTQIVGSSRSTVTCEKVDGTTHDVTVTTAANITPGDAMQFPQATCPAGEVALTSRIDWNPNGTSDWTPIATGTAPEVTTTLPSLYPKCYGPDAEVCQLKLYEVDDGKLTSCGAGATLCPDWAKSDDPDSSYRCKFGPYTTPIDMCSAMRNPAVGLQTNVKTDGSLRSVTDPDDVTDTTVKNTTQVTRVINNTVIRNIWKAPETVTDPIIDTSTDPDGDCFPSGWGVLNPVSWVLQPIGCALKAAFIPSKSGMDEITAKRDAVLGKTSLGQVSKVGDSLLGAFNITATGCKGPAMTVDIGFLGVTKTSYPMDACAEPVAGTASAVKSMLAFSIVLLTVISATRYIGGTIGFVGWASTVDSGESSGPRFK